MNRIVFDGSLLETVSPKNEAEFERAIVANATHIFGPDRHYLDCKRRIGAKGGKQNIPDAYLIDLRRGDPMLYVVENELARHDLFKHIGVQLLEFSFSYRQAGRRLKTVLFEELEKQPEIRGQCEVYAKEHGFRNLDYLLEYLVFDTPFKAIVIIDDATDELHSVVKQFRFPVEILTFQTYVDANGRKAYGFAPFLEDLETPAIKKSKGGQISDIDTIVVPARDDGFQSVFLDENRWYKIRMHSSMIPQIKHCAVYRVAPVSAITHVAPVSSIEPWEDTGKFVVNFSEPAREIDHVALNPRSKMALQAPRYTSLSKLTSAKTLKDLFG